MPTTVNTTAKTVWTENDADLFEPAGSSEGCHSWRDLMPEWLSRQWWKYVLDDSRADKEYGHAYARYFELPHCLAQKTGVEGFYNPITYAYNWLERAVCRARNHPAGVWWYCSICEEPDMTCRSCGEDLG